MTDEEQIRRLIQRWAVAAHAGVAFAIALLRRGNPADFARELAQRLTIGMIKRDGAWVTTHEHHSFADGSP